MPNDKDDWFGPLGLDLNARRKTSSPKAKAKTAAQDHAGAAAQPGGGSHPKAKAKTAAQDHAGAAAQPGGEPAKQIGEKVGPDGEKTAGEGKKPAGEGEKPAGEGKSEGSGVAVAAFQWLVSKSGDATLKAQVGSAMPNGKTANDFTWKGPVKTIAEYPREKSLLHLTTIAYAEVEIAFYYSGKYINNFHAKLIDAELDKTASLDCELAVDDSNVGNSADGIAHIDWTVTFRRGHFMGSKLVTVTGRASGDGTYTTSQPSYSDFAQEAAQEVAAQVAAHTPHKP